MLGDLIPVMTGVAMAGRYLGQKIVAMTWIGDGGSSTGAFHEGLNLAAAQRAPLVLVLENNQWAYSTPVSRQVPLRESGGPRRAYGIASAIVDGNDVSAVYRSGERSGRAMPRRARARADRSENHAHEGPRAARSRRIRAQGDVRVLEGARSHRALSRDISPPTSLWDDEEKAEIDARIDRELAEEQRIRGGIADAAAESWPSRASIAKAATPIEAEWQRPKEEVMPPKSSVDAVWKLKISVRTAKCQRH